MPSPLRIAFAAAAFLCRVPGHASSVSDGQFDSTWAGGGSITFAGDVAHSAYNSSVDRLLIESNGNVLLVGQVQGPSFRYWWLGELFGSGQFIGQFVPTFGLADSSGRVTACQLGFDCMKDETIAAIALQPDGKYLLATDDYLWCTTALAHAFDTSGVSGGTGHVSNVFTINDVGGTVAASQALAFLPGGKILAGGNAYYGSASTTPLFGIVRLNADLSLDTTFNAMTDGKGVTFAGGAAITVSDSDFEEFLQAILLQSDGRIVLVGHADGDSVGLRIEAVRLNANGSLDASYGTSGTTAVAWTGGTGSGSESMAVIDTANRVLVPLSGITNGTSIAGMLVLRLDANGLPDATFGSSGFAFNANPSACTTLTGSSLALDSVGRIVVVGQCGVAGSSNEAFAMERLRGDKGTLDTSFGVSGWSFGYFEPYDTYYNNGEAIVLDGSGRPIVVGGTRSSIAAPVSGAAARVTYDLIHANGFEDAPPGCLYPDCLF